MKVRVQRHTLATLPRAKCRRYVLVRPGASQDVAKKNISPLLIFEHDSTAFEPPACSVYRLHYSCSRKFYHPWKIIHTCVSFNVRSKTPIRGKQTSITRLGRLSHYHVSKNRVCWATEYDLVRQLMTSSTKPTIYS